MRSCSLTWLIYLAASLLTANAYHLLPAPLKPCAVEDEVCLMKQAQDIFRSLKYGLPELGMPRFDPLELGTIRLDTGGPGASLQFNLLMRNTTMHKFADTVVFKTLKGFSADLTRPMKIIWTVSTPGVEVHADYEVDGKLLILPIVSKGKLVIELNQLQSKTRVNVLPEKRADGKTHLKIVDYKTVAKVASGSFNMSNLFNENAELRDSTLKVLNDEWTALAAELQPKIIEATDRAYSVALQKLWDAVPYEEFLIKE